MLASAEGICRGHGDTISPFRSSLLCGMVNFILDPILMFRPMNMKLAGAAAATSFAQYVSTFYLCKTVWKNRAVMLPDLTEKKTFDLRKTLNVLKIVLKANAALLVRSFSLLGCWSVATYTCTKIGEAHAAAHQIALSVFLLFCLLGEAPSIAGQVLIARRQTRGQKAASRQLVRRLSRYSISAGLCAGTATFFAGILSPTLFSVRDGAIRSLLSQTMLVAALTQPICTLCLGAEGLVTGCKAFKFAATSSLLTSIMISASMIFFAKNAAIGVSPICLFGRQLFKDGLGVRGVWMHIAVLFTMRLAAAILCLSREITGPDIVYTDNSEDKAIGNYKEATTDRDVDLLLAAEDVEFGMKLGQSELAAEAALESEREKALEEMEENKMKWEMEEMGVVMLDTNQSNKDRASKHSKSDNRYGISKKYW